MHLICFVAYSWIELTLFAHLCNIYIVRCYCKWQTNYWRFTSLNYVSPWSRVTSNGFQIKYVAEFKLWIYTYNNYIYDNNKDYTLIVSVVLDSNNGVCMTSLNSFVVFGWLLNRMKLNDRFLFPGSLVSTVDGIQNYDLCICSFDGGFSFGLL